MKKGDKMKKIAINGFGRIGRLAFRIISELEGYEVVAINDLTSAEDLAYYLKYDTNHRNFRLEDITFDEDEIIFEGRHIKVYSEKEPINLPWKELNIDLVLECTGFFTSVEKSQAHIDAGAKHVLISAPAKGDLKTIVYGVNDDILDGSEKIISAASCITNCLAPVLKVLDDNFKIVKGMMSTVHAYTNDQTTLDVPHKKGINARRGRAAAMNIIPASTGAASAIGQVMPNLEGKLDGMAFRVPVSDGSVIDLTLELERLVTKETINEVLKQNTSNVLGYTDDPVVSSDILGSRYASLVDGQSTNVVTVAGKQLVKVVSWYDNEMSYTTQMIRTMKTLLEKQ